MDVLLVEDEHDMRVLLQSVLERRGHTVTAVADGESGWKAYQSRDFPIVILDWLLPGMDGLELCRKIRNMPNGADSLILVITVRTNPGDLELVLAACADDYLAKPVDVDLLNIRLTIAEQRASILIQRRAVEASRRAAETRCTQAQTMLRLVLDTIPVRVFWKDQESRYLGCNRRFAMDAGLQDPSQIIGKTDHDLGWTEQAQLYIADDRAVMQSRLPKLNYEELRTAPDGELIYLETSKIPLTDGEGNLIGVLGTYQDITERKRVDAEMIAAQSQLRATLDAIPDLMFEVGLDGRYHDYHSSHLELLIAPPEDFIGKTVIDVLPPEAAEVVMSALREAHETGRSHGRQIKLPVPQGILWFELSISRKPVADGLEPRFIVLSRDITEHKRSEAELIAAKDQAEEANRAKSAFLSRMSHELRTPLNAILGFAQVMEMSADDETMAAYRDNLKTILRSGWHLLRIIEDLLNLSAIEANKVVLNIENIEARKNLTECIALISPLAQERRIAIDCADDACEDVMVQADSFRLKQVLINLLANAVKYNRDGGSVTVSSQRIPGRIRILVSDTGQGIPEAEYTSLFQPFSRLAQRPYSIEGAGIGLSIAKQLTELMGGTIGVESEHGKGSTFWIELPATEAPEAAHATVDALPPLNEVTTCHQTTLLYIEDNPDHVDLVRTIISRMGNLSLFSAHTPSLGLDLARTQRPNIILLDICLPGMNGYEVLGLLQTDKRTRQIPVMAVSATVNPAEIEKGLRAGFRRYLTKPLNIVEFRNAIEELLRDVIE